jgi:hypothetical protein
VGVGAFVRRLDLVAFLIVVEAGKLDDVIFVVDDQDLGGHYSLLERPCAAGRMLLYYNAAMGDVVRGEAAGRTTRTPSLQA